MFQNSRRARLLAAATVLGLAPLLGACGDDDAPDPDVGVPTVTDPAGGEGYFADDSHVGEQVTITAMVDQDLTDESVVLDAGEQGDDSLLVLFKGEQPEFAEGATVTVSGTVQRFSYDEYSDEYGLAEAALFEAYADEEFLLADSITPQSGQPTS